MCSTISWLRKLISRWRIKIAHHYRRNRPGLRRRVKITLALVRPSAIGSILQDHVIPAENFYRWSGVHVIFGDDVLVTGATADKVLYESLCNGARSVSCHLPSGARSWVALTDASVEDRLNSVSVKQHLDENVAQRCFAPGYQPILRALRLLFGEDNRDSLPAFLPNVPVLIRPIQICPQSKHQFCSTAPSLVMLRTYLMQNGLLCAKGKVLVKYPTHYPLR